MKLPTLLIRKKKLRASTARRSMAAPDEMDYEEMSEPNMKLSRALLIVLVLHVVAVAGIIAFNTIKSRQGTIPMTKTSATSAAASVNTSVPPTKTDATTSVSAPALAAKSTSKDEAKIPKALPLNSDSDNVYVVAKGDNPVKIAKKFKVSESELLAVNHIDDPRKLQIGQKLLIPSAKKAKSKADAP